MKYFFGRVEERYGDIQSHDCFVFCVNSTQQVEDVALEIARDHRGVDVPDCNGWYWFDGYCHGPVDYLEITFEEYEVLRKFL